MRLSVRSTISVLATAALSLGLVACGGGGGDDDDDVQPTGDHYHYVVDSVTIPLDSTSATALGMDLDGDGTVDNQLGNILSALIQAGGQSLDLQGSIDTSVLQGDILLLADLQTTDLSAASAVGFSLYLGTNPNPAPCTDPNDITTCGQHLNGDATFDVDPSQPTGARVVGTIAGGTFNGGPGDLGLQIALSAGSPINLRLVNARARVTGITGTDLGNSIVAGAVPDENIQNDVIPAVHTTVSNVIADDCTGSGTDCGCTADSTGLTVLGIFDDDGDCTVTLDEIRMNSLIVTLLRPDVDTDGDGTNDALSVGVGATAIGATYTQP
ncbi:MAG: hypothetical protein H6708_17245 [Kofleriaceae bacterium]|nr:hypothetical protein [Myxococcales bacterium]MCB9562153.1 hypothetical protein [Kofleriaceae bacterium]